MRTLQRACQSLLTVLVVATATFVLVRLAPGDPFTSALENTQLTPALRAQLRATYGLDGSIGTQYLHWIGALAHGSLGWSTSMSMPVSQAIASALPATLALMGTSLGIAFALGIGIGALQARRQGSIADRLLGAGTLVGAAVPDFWLALVVLLGGAYWLRLFPVGGAADPLLPLTAGAGTVVIDRLHHLVLPAGTLVLLITAAVARQQRAALLDRLGAGWVRTATAKGVSPGTVFRRHALRNALGPVVTLAGLALPALVGGAVFVETVFAWPGMGQLASSAVATRDYHLVIGCVIVGSLMVVVGSALADVALQRLDPRTADAGADPGARLA